MVRLKFPIKSKRSSNWLTKQTLKFGLSKNPIMDWLIGLDCNPIISTLLNQGGKFVKAQYFCMVSKVSSYRLLISWKEEKVITIS